MNQHQKASSSSAGFKVRGILKSPNRSEEGLVPKKHARIDEYNIMHTMHTTTYSVDNMNVKDIKMQPERTSDNFDGLPLDLDLLKQRLRTLSNTQSISFGDDDNDNDNDNAQSDVDYTCLPGEFIRTHVFETRRKAYDVEFFSVEMARELIREEFGDYDFTQNHGADSSSSSSSRSSGGSGSGSVCGSCCNDSSNQTLTTDPRIVSSVQMVEADAIADIDENDDSHAAEQTEQKLDFERDSTRKHRPAEQEFVFDETHPCYEKMLRARENQ